MFNLKIVQDSDPENPRVAWDNAATMVCFHNRYTLGDEHDLKSEDFDGWADMEEHIAKISVAYKPLYLYDHSGYTIATKPFSCRWDSGQVGWIYMTREQVLDNFQRKRVTQHLLKRAYDLMESEVETYDSYLTGDVWGYVIEDEDGEEVEACWGYYGIKYAEEDGKIALKNLFDSVKKEAA